MDGGTSPWLGGWFIGRRTLSFLAVIAHRNVSSRLRREGRDYNAPPERTVLAFVHGLCEEDYLDTKQRVYYCMEVFGVMDYSPVGTRLAHLASTSGAPNNTNARQNYICTIKHRTKRFSFNLNLGIFCHGAVFGYRT